jgi:PAS domain S-box-containing protein
MGETTRKARKPATRYLGAVLAVLAAFVVREAVASVAGPDFSQYVVFYPTVMTVALLAGLWPALLAILAAAAVFIVLGMLPVRILPYSMQAMHLVNLGFFVVVCVFLAVVAEISRTNRAKAAAWDKEAALRQSHALVRQQAELLRLSFDAIIVWKIGGGIESWNRGAEELYGFAEQQALGRGIHELLRTNHDEPWLQFERLLGARGSWHGELEHLTREGRKVVVSTRLHIGHGADNEQRVLQIDRDITEQKRVQKELQSAHDDLEEKVQKRTAELQAANRMLLMVSGCDQALAQIADERELIGVICQIIHDEGPYPLVWVGLTGEAGAPLTCVASAGDRDGYFDSLRAEGGAAALAAGPPSRAVHTGALCLAEDLATEGPGDAWQVQAVRRGVRAVAALPLLREHAEPFGVLVVCSDRIPGFERSQVTLLSEIAGDLAFGIVSLRARAERDHAKQALETQAAQLRVLAAELVRTEQRERRRIAQLLHDQLQQHLAAALFGLADLDSATPPGHVVSRINGLLRECIDVSRSLTSELGHPALSEPDITVGLDWLASWMRENHGLEVSLRSPAAVLVPAEETRATLLQAVRELLFNVVKHSGVRTAELAVHAGHPGRVEVTVSDAGIGFDEARLVQVHGPGAAGPQGGLGLFSIRERLTWAGGGISIASARGTGSRITVWIPVTPPGEPIETAPAESPASDSAVPVHRPAPSDGRIRLLLVDDHAVVREGLALRLARHPDMEVVGEAADGARAIDLARQLRPDVITMDVSMPGMGGVEATRRIHAVLPEAAIIGLSMFDDARQSAAMREVGALLHLSKSASIESLVEAIRSCAGRTPGARPPG